jgi:catechol 2,3-dioxygenase-like lactoylglutathione lyase family enzyme
MTNRISRLQLVVVPSSDQDRSIEFYEALGFEKRNEGPFGDGHRWVEVYPPDGKAGIALAPAPEGGGGVQTGIILNTDDIDGAHAELRERGVDVDESVARQGAPAEIQIGGVRLVGPSPPMFYFRDPDGNALLLVESPL